MDLGGYLGVLRARWVSILVLTALGAAGGYLLTARDQPLYRSTSTVYLVPAHGETVSELNQGAAYTSNLMQTYSLMATTPVVLDPVIETLGLSTSPRALARTITTDVPLNTYFITITASSPDAGTAADVANAVSTQLADAVGELSPAAADGKGALRMTQVSPATPAASPYSPRPRLSAALGLFLGLTVGVGLALLRQQLDTRVRSVNDLPEGSDRTLLGQLPHDKAHTGTSPLVLASPHSVAAESFRRVRANLQFLDASRPVHTHVITSSLPGEGKSTTAVNLSLVMAERGLRVLLVDADLRSPSIADICGLEPAVGLSAVLIGEASIEVAAQPWQLLGLDVITSGVRPPNPSQLIDSRAMELFLSNAAARYDVVIIDTPPLLAVADAAVLARKTDGAIVVARAKSVRRAELAEAIHGLDTVGATVLGLLLNDVRDDRSDSRYGYGMEDHRRRAPRRHGAGRRGRSTTEATTWSPTMASSTGDPVPAPSETDTSVRARPAPEATTEDARSRDTGAVHEATPVVGWPAVRPSAGAPAGVVPAPSQHADAAGGDVHERQPPEHPGTDELTSVDALTTQEPPTHAM